MNKLVLYSSVGYLSTSKLTKKVTLPHGSRIQSTVVVNPRNEVMTVNIDKESDTVTKSGAKYSGNVVDVTEKFVTIAGPTRRTISNYDEIKYGNYVVSSDVEFRLGVLIDNISWKCSATCTLNNSVLVCRFTGVITNLTKDVISADVILVSGKPNLPQPRPRFSASTKSSYAAPESASMAESSYLSPVEEEDLSEYKQYRVGEITIKDVVIVELTFFQVDVTKFYHHVTQSDTVNFGYSFVAPAFVPACRAGLYTDDLTTIIGSGTFKESQVDEEVEFLVGDTTKIRCISRVEKGSVSDRIVFSIASMEYPLQLTLMHFVGNRPIMRIIPEYERVIKEGMLRLTVDTNKDIEGVITVEFSS